MTKLLQQFIEAAKKLSPEQQDAVAARALNDLWERALDESAQTLSAMAFEARAEDDAGLTTPLDPDDL